MLNVSCWEADEVLAALLEVVVWVAEAAPDLVMDGVYPGRVCTWVAEGSC